ncbi:TPA: ATP-dependent helicase, partial [Candidatus Sumerlaeota bacterium]|nr:ATP-dependent helicase [Candidatus Sumerlaeota bacterium]
ETETREGFSEVTVAELPEVLREACTRAGWTTLTPVQAKSIPYFMAKRDLMVQSRTGSGKTGAFVLPILERIDMSRPTCQALILTPTRELARQVAEAAHTLAGDVGLRVAAVFGGVDFRPQLEAFRLGAHIVVGTPGRVLDHLMSGALSLKDLRILVLDEADRMLSMGFYQDMRRVRSFMPRESVNSCLFSATFPPYVLSLAREFLRDAEMLSLSHDQLHVAETEHVFYNVPPMDKDRALAQIIEIENPTSAIIFCNTKSRTHYITVVLQRFGYDAAEISADIGQKERDEVMERARNGSLRFLVATDIAARGIDIPNLSHVVQYEPPDDPENYIHRAGRTGRNGAAGEAITLVEGMEKLQFVRMTKRLGVEVTERPLPTQEEVEDVVAQRVTALLEARLRDRDKLQIERMRRFYPLAKGLGENDEELDLVAMLIDDYYQNAIHGSLVLPEPTVVEKKTSSDGNGKSKPRARSRQRR